MLASLQPHHVQLTLLSAKEKNIANGPQGGTDDEPSWTALISYSCCLRCLYACKDLQEIK